ncbi:unnamed protein product [Brassica napus]|uniref:(rape) hypothetical protein n=1 Tax=Brassica napus TaxID=3708 RepID=A0A816PIX3_BRANA|nr:unnamed protein product [Brassica napus]
MDDCLRHRSDVTLHEPTPQAPTHASNKVKANSRSFQMQNGGQGRQSERDHDVGKRKRADEEEGEASGLRYAPRRAVRAGADLDLLCRR